jgi:diguanylate cyclase (GGDEF)-like protein
MYLMNVYKGKIPLFVSVLAYIFLVYLMFLFKDASHLVIPFFIIPLIFIDYEGAEIKFLFLTLLFFLSLLFPKFFNMGTKFVIYNFFSFLSVLIFSTTKNSIEKKKFKQMQDITKEVNEIEKNIDEINSSISFYQKYIDELSTKIDIKSKLINILKDIENSKDTEQIIRKLITSVSLLYPRTKTEFIVIPKQGIINDVFLTKVPVFIPSVTKEVRYRLSYFAEDEKSLLFLPLVCFSKVYGVLKVYSDKDSYFDLDDFRILEIITTTASISIENISLFKITEELAIKDALTNLYTHRAFQDKLDEEILVSARTKKPFLLSIIDIDHFKKINDNYGHQVGDEVLKCIAGIIKNSVREFDFVARYGGEEFAIIMPQTDKEEGIGILKNIRERIKNYSFTLNNKVINLSVSIGVSLFPGEALSKSQLIRVADERLYRAKNEGRDRIVYE